MFLLAIPCRMAPLYNGLIVKRQTFDSEYVRLLAQSDPETWKHFEAYFGELLSIKLHSRLRNRELIDDVIQETFSRVLQALRRDSIDHPASLGPFVDTCCNRALFDVYKHQTRTAEAPSVNRPDGSIATEEALALEQSREEVRRVLAGLPARERKILRLLFLEELGKEEICRTLGVDREYLRVLVHRAKSRFLDNWSRRNR